MIGVVTFWTSSWRETRAAAAANSAAKNAYPSRNQANRDPDHAEGLGVDAQPAGRPSDGDAHRTERPRAGPGRAGRCRRSCPVSRTRGRMVASSTSTTRLDFSSTTPVGDPEPVPDDLAVQDDRCDERDRRAAGRTAGRTARRSPAPAAARPARSSPPAGSMPWAASAWRARGPGGARLQDGGQRRVERVLASRPRAPSTSASTSPSQALARRPDGGVGDLQREPGRRRLRRACSGDGRRARSGEGDLARSIAADAARAAR